MLAEKTEDKHSKWIKEGVILDQLIQYRYGTRHIGTYERTKSVETILLCMTV